MANKKKRKHKEVFHKPQTVGERTKLKMTPALIALSALSLGVQIGGTIFAIVGAVILHNQGYGQSGLLLALPIVMWVISIGPGWASSICRWICGGCPSTCARAWWSATAGC